jgi:hypothetical protein
MKGEQGGAASPFHQPKAVWAVALACVVSFMGIGLVDPILPALSKQLHASPSSVELLFTSYLVVTAVAMLVGRRIASFANDLHAQMVVIGTSSDTEIARAFDADLTDTLLREAGCAVHIVPTGSDQWAFPAMQPAAR